MNVRSIARILATALAVAGCRDAADPFNARDREPVQERVWQLTFSTGDDRAPAWTPDGSTIVYSADGFGSLPAAPDLLLEIRFRGGVAQLALQNVQEQPTSGRRLATPTVAADGERLAFVQFERLFDQELCGPLAVECDGPTSEPLRRPALGSALLRVRRFDASGPLPDDPTLHVEFEGRTFDPTPQPSGLTGVWIIDYLPFHPAYVEDMTFVFRPSWSPDGTRLVYSDGLRLLIWEPGAGTVTAIPNTSDAISPRWSPTGDRIAYTRLGRAGSETRYCVHFVQDTDSTRILGCAEERTTHFVEPPRVMRIRPDGTDLEMLTEGDEPTWTPDGQRLLFRRDDRIWSVDLATGAESPIPDTEGGREPAVSPDGRYVALARRVENQDYDLWIVELAP